MRKFPLIVILVVLLAGACGRQNDSNEKEKEALNSLIDWLYTKEGESLGVGRLSQELPPMQTQGRYDEIFNDSNYVQYQFAEHFGIHPIHSLKEAYNTRRPLVKVETCGSYKVDSLTHSMPYLVPEAAALLQDIGNSFLDSVEKRYGTRDNMLIVTSLLRSPYSVKKLRRVNRNAVDSSTHMFATTFDIAYNKYWVTDSTKVINEVALKDILAEVLLQKRLEGRCLVKYERKSPCFHITVAR